MSHYKRLTISLSVLFLLNLLIIWLLTTRF